LRVRLLSDGHYGRNYLASFYFLEVNEFYEIMPFAEWYNDPLETDTEKAEMAATDPEYGVDMTVDVITCRRGENKPELPESYFEKRR
jgi:hypothetical protein